MSADTLLDFQRISCHLASAYRCRQRLLATQIPALGRTIKEAAYDLGISDSTVRVLLARAYARLGIRSQQELLNLPAVRALREGRRH